MKLTGYAKSFQIMQWPYWKLLQDRLNDPKVTFHFHIHSDASKVSKLVVNWHKCKTLWKWPAQIGTRLGGGGGCGRWITAIAQFCTRKNRASVFRTHGFETTPVFKSNLPSTSWFWPLNIRDILRGSEAKPVQRPFTRNDRSTGKTRAEWHRNHLLTKRLRSKTTVIFSILLIKDECEISGQQAAHLQLLSEETN